MYAVRRIFRIAILVLFIVMVFRVLHMFHCEGVEEKKDVSIIQHLREQPSFVIGDEAFSCNHSLLWLNQMPVQYSHVGKTGGTTVDAVLIEWQRMVLPNKLHHYYGNFTLEGILKWNCRGIDNFDSGLFLGQVGIGYCDKMVQAGVKPFTIITLREPIELFRSGYEYVIEHPMIYPETVYLNNKSLSEWIVYWDKNQNSHGAVMFRQVLKSSSSHLCGVHQCSGLTDTEALSLALKNLKKCDVVAVTEKLKEILDQFRFLLPDFNKVFDCNYRLPFKNKVKKSKEPLTKEALEILNRWAKYEKIIYKEGLARHEYLTKRARVCMALESK